MSRAKEIFPRAILGTRAIGMSTLVWYIRRTHIGLSQNVTKRHISWCFSVQPGKIHHSHLQRIFNAGRKIIYCR
jgi:hypothetical protein